MPQGVESKASIYDIANRVGVSIATVSRVINNDPRVAAATRERVLKAVRAANYRPKVVLNRVTTLGIVVKTSFAAVEFLASEYVTRIIKGVAEYAFGNGLNISVIPLDGKFEGSNGSLLRLLRERSCDGAIVVSPTQESFMQDFAAESFPVVSVGRKYANPNLLYVGIDNRGGTAEAVRHLYDLGHRVIVYIEHQSLFAQYDHAERLEAYRQTMGKLGLEPLVIDREINYVREVTPGFVATVRRCLLERSPRPSGILCSYDMMACLIVRAMSLAGCQAPNDYSIVGHDNTRLAAHFIPGLSSVNQPLCQLGSTAAELIDRRIAGRPLPVVEPFPCRLVKRETTGFAPRG